MGLFYFLFQCFLDSWWCIVHVKNRSPSFLEISVSPPLPYVGKLKTYFSHFTKITHGQFDGFCTKFHMGGALQLRSKND